MEKIKYPRTFHLPWSEGISSDDKIQADLSNFENKETVITLKVDGENTTMSRIYYHARSLDSVNHPSRNWAKGLWGKIKHEIPEDWRICGENLYAEHSLHYYDLPSYFMVFSIWNEKNFCLSLDETLEWCELLGLEHVPILWRGKFDLEFIKNFKVDTEKQEGFVMRLTRSFHFDNFNESVVKWVRAGHIKDTNTHWMSKPIIPNGLKK